MSLDQHTTYAPLYQATFSDDKPPKVSVIVMAYEQESFIEKCLNSILAQNVNFSVEIIVHDDASKDKTSRIAFAYARKFPHIFKVFVQKENQLSKLLKFRPLLLSKCKGQYIANCDGDDFWTDPNKLRKQVTFLDQHPDYVMSFHDAIKLDKTGKVLTKNVLSQAARRDYTASELRVSKWGVMLIGTMMHRNVNIDFPPEYNLVPNGDNFYPMLLALHGAAKFQNEVGPLAYLQHESGMWSSKSESEKNQMHVRTYLAIVGYFVRVGETQNAKALIGSRLNSYLQQYTSG
jgi:glycosyltransferase involved in cell wall biosynthesis